MHQQGVPEDDESDKGQKCLFKDIMAINFPDMGDRKGYLDRGSPKSTKRGESKKTHTKTHYN